MVLHQPVKKTHLLNVRATYQREAESRGTSEFYHPIAVVHVDDSLAATA
jgi:hypothetical protein